MNSSDRLSRKAAAAFLGGVCVAIQGIDADPPEIRSSKRFLQVLDAAFEQISLEYPDLDSQERAEFQHLALDLHKTMKTQEFPGLENLL